MYEKTFPHKRYALTLDFLKKHVPVKNSILDLGVENPFSEIMKKEGYTVTNTTGEDVDVDQSALAKGVMTYLPHSKFSSTCLTHTLFFKM
jgi:hypothetical protein